MIVSAREILPLALVLVLAGVSCAESADVGRHRLIIVAPVELQVLLDPLMRQYTARVRTHVTAPSPTRVRAS